MPLPDVTVASESAIIAESRDQGDRDSGSFTATRDCRNLFGARPDNAFLIKAAYWLGM